MLAVALEEEVKKFLGRIRYQRGREFRGYRNGYHPLREVTVGQGSVEVRVPRVSKVPPEAEPQGFHPQIVTRYQWAFSVWWRKLSAESVGRYLENRFAGYLLA